MDTPNRSVIAYIAGRLITGADGWWMQDLDRGHPVHFEGSCDPASVKIYSHELHSYVSGVGEEGKYTLFQHGVGGTVDLRVNLEARTFSGWEHLSGFHFFGHVADRTIHLYDYQGLEWHLYTL